MKRLPAAWRLSAAIGVALMTQTMVQTASADDLQVLKAQMSAMQKKIAELEAKQANSSKASAKTGKKVLAGKPIQKR